MVKLPVFIVIDPSLVGLLDLPGLDFFSGALNVTPHAIDRIPAGRKRPGSQNHQNGKHQTCAHFLKPLSKCDF
ncbi:hypothetical protein [Micavibrio aeruginosavorus]|uniref:hypothetical protein n=1 Tax=Micavibrio aeruginosavorus TaxID=349221 RepID=UPI003F4A9E31